MSIELSDAQLWQAVITGDTQAFERVVERYQGVVSAIAYSRLGSLETSQDVAQETFWVAWSSRAQLRDMDRLAAWLCGIARNLSHQQSRKSSPTNITGIDQQAELAGESDPLEQSIASEQASIVWHAVHDLPEHYRECMVLYYRQEHSISQVAAALELSEDAVKQRLSRARTMLRDELTGLIEETLVRSRPGKSFTAKVMSGLVAMGVVSQASKTAVAGTASVIGGSLLGKAAGGGTATFFTGSVLGLLGGIAGGLGGLGGAWIGTHLPAELAPTETERQLLKVRGRETFRIALIYTVVIIASVVIFQLWIRNVVLYLAIFAITQIVFFIVIALKAIQIQKEIKAIREKFKPEDDPNTSTLRQRFPILNRKYRGRKFTSQWTFGGWPLVDIQFSDPTTNGTMPLNSTARGWIAIGDRAVGLIAIGGIAVGGVAFGGLAVGGFAFGGGAIGVLSIGGGALGVIALGGGAIGWQAAGGVALAINKAFGGAAIAWHFAAGGYALAHDLATGGGGGAAAFNTPEAKQLMEEFWMKRAMDNFKSYFWPFIIVYSIFITSMSKLCYVRVKSEGST